MQQCFPSHLSGLAALRPVADHDRVWFDNRASSRGGDAWEIPATSRKIRRHWIRLCAVHSGSSRASIPAGTRGGWDPRRSTAWRASADGKRSGQGSMGRNRSIDSSCRCRAVTDHARCGSGRSRLKFYDSLHVQAVINQIDGFNHDRSRRVGPPRRHQLPGDSVGEDPCVDWSAASWRLLTYSAPQAWRANSSSSINRWERWSAN